MLFSHGTYRQSGVCIVLKPSAYMYVSDVDGFPWMVGACSFG